MRAGRLRHPILIQKPVGTTGDFGTSTVDWADFFLAWATVQPLTGNERVEAQQINAAVNYRITLRCRPDLTISPQHRVKYNDRIFDILSVINVDERNHTLELYCAEGNIA